MLQCVQQIALNKTKQKHKTCSFFKLKSELHNNSKLCLQDCILEANFDEPWDSDQTVFQMAFGQFGLLTSRQAVDTARSVISWLHANISNRAQICHCKKFPNATLNCCSQVQNAPFSPPTCRIFAAWSTFLPWFIICWYIPNSSSDSCLTCSCVLTGNPRSALSFSCQEESEHESAVEARICASVEMQAPLQSPAFVNKVGSGMKSNCCTSTKAHPKKLVLKENTERDQLK